jgi:hypothetical protein
MSNQKWEPIKTENPDVMQLQIGFKICTFDTEDIQLIKMLMPSISKYGYAETTILSYSGYKFVPCIGNILLKTPGRIRFKNNDYTDYRKCNIYIEPT